VAASVLIGDFFHNFTDGILLGTAFSICHRELAVTIAVATVYHELAQEIADFFLLTKHYYIRIPVELDGLPTRILPSTHPGTQSHPDRCGAGQVVQRRLLQRTETVVTRRAGPNFVGGLSVMLGPIIILLFDISSNTTGCILAMGGGVYVYIVAAECLPRAKDAQKTTTDKLLSFASFVVVGVVPIGLVILNYGHYDG
jgi:zinc transporter ZupT